MKTMFYEIMHRESCVAQLSTTGECKICLEDFMPCDLVLVESDDFDERINNVTNFYYWCASRMLTLDRTYAKEILNSIGASPVSYTHLDVYKRQAIFQTLQKGNSGENHSTLSGRRVGDSMGKGAAAERGLSLRLAHRPRR